MITFMISPRNVKLPFFVTVNDFHWGFNINGGDVQRKNVVNNVDKSSLWAP